MPDFVADSPKVGDKACPECQQGKHGNCNGETWDMLGDFPAVCPCFNRGHDEGEDEPEWPEHTTPLGCRIRLTPLPEHLGEGLMLVLQVDTRFAEVALDPETLRWLTLQTEPWA